MVEKLEIKNIGIEQPENQQLETGVTDLRQRTEVPREVKSWLEQIEVDPTQQKTVNGGDGQPLLQLPVSQDTKVKLPITRTNFADGFKKAVDDAGRWFSTFIFRLIKINKGKVKFEEE